MPAKFLCQVISAFENFIITGATDDIKEDITALGLEYFMR